MPGPCSSRPNRWTWQCSPVRWRTTWACWPRKSTKPSRSKPRSPCPCGWIGWCSVRPSSTSSITRSSTAPTRPPSAWSSRSTSRGPRSPSSIRVPGSRPSTARTCLTASIGWIRRAHENKEELEELASASPSRAGPWKSTAAASSWRARRAREAPSAWCFPRQRPSRHQGVPCLAMLAVGDTGDDGVDGQDFTQGERRMNMQKNFLMLCAVGMLGIGLTLGFAQRARTAEYTQEEYGPLLAVLSQSKLTLVDGIKQAAAKAPETAISAKFELDDHKQLSLSVYTAEKGLETDAEHNTLKELAGSPAGSKWSPAVEVFADAAHLKRAAAQLTLMALSPHALLEIIAKAGQAQPGTVFSITPVVEHHQPHFVVLVAAQGKVVALRYDLMTGESMKKG